MSMSPPDLPTKPVRRSLMERFSIVWLIPVLALMIALGVAWSSYADRGPLIVISFESASGVKAGETDLRYRDISVGLVEKVAFADSLSKVDVSVRLEKDIAEYVDADASFWVVRPEVTTQGVSGLDTVLSGVFIAGLWDTEPKGLAARHDGLEHAPLLGVGEAGLQIELRATAETSLAENSPILYKGITVGRLGKPRLVGDGTEAVADAIIYSPHDKLISSATRFWDVSGFSFTIGAGGADIDFKSLASLISGGVTFDTIVSGGQPVSAESKFDVYADEVTARASVFSDSSGPPLQLAVIFEENVSGLAPEAPVELSGVRIGSVTALQGIVDPERFGDNRVRLLATFAVRPERLGLGEAISPEEALDYIASQVDKGLRARLATTSILTGGLKIELLRVEAALPQELDRSGEGAPIMPSTASNIKDVAATAEGVLKRVNDLPIEELLGSVITFLDSAKTLIGNEELQRAPGEIVGLVEDARGIIGSEAIQAIPENLSALMTGLQGATDDLSTILAQLSEADAVNRLLAAVDAAGVAAGQVGPALQGVPDLIANIDALAAKANALPIEDLLAQANALTASAQSLFSSESTQALPDNVNILLGNLNSATDNLSTVLSQVTEGNTVARLTNAIDAAAVAATDVGTAIAGAPALIEQINALATKANALPLEDLIAQARGLTTSANSLLSAESTQALPDNVNVLLGNLNTATDSLSTVLAQVTDANTVTRLTNAIDAAAVAATDVGTAIEGAPALIEQINALAAKVNALPVETLVSETTAVMNAAQSFLGSDSTKALPDSLNGALADLQKIVSEITAENGVARLLASIDAAGEAATKAGTSFDGVPALIDQISAVADKANALPLDKLVEELTAVLDSADAILATDGAKDLPVALSGALTQLDQVLTELRQGGTVQNVNSTLASAANAADAVAKAADNLPSLVDRVNRLINQATGTLSSIDGSSEINRDVRSALRQMQRAAEAVSSLARALERRPNSIILGR